MLRQQKSPLVSGLFDYYLGPFLFPFAAVRLSVRQFYLFLRSSIYQQFLNFF